MLYEQHRAVILIIILFLKQIHGEVISAGYIPPAYVYHYE